MAKLISFHWHWAQNMLRVIAISWVLITLPAVANAQTQEVHEGPWTDEDAQEWSDQIRRSREILSMFLDTSKFSARMNFKEVLGQAYDQLADKGIEFTVLVDSQAFKDENQELDVLQLPIRLPPIPERITVSKLLHEILDQIPGKCATVVFRPGNYIEITTDKDFAGEARQARSGLGWLERLWNGNQLGPEGISLSEIEGSSLNTGQLLILAGVLCGCIGGLICWMRPKWRTKQTGNIDVNRPKGAG
jgi:hypothetical protein